MYLKWLKGYSQLFLDGMATKVILLAESGIHHLLATASTTICAASPVACAR